MILGDVGYVILTIVSWLIVLAGVDTEDREVARVARPHPVVRIATEFPYGSWRCEDETNIAEDIVGNEVVLVIGIVRTDSDLLVLILETCRLSLLHAFADLTDLVQTIKFILRLLDLC